MTRTTKKVIEKQLKNDEEELALQAEKARNLKILEAQGAPKRKREPSQKVPKSAKDPQLPKGFRNIPPQLRKHFPKDHVLLLSKPDGVCGISCGAAHILGLLSKGKELRREINKHIVSNWLFYRNKIDFPYSRQVGVSGDMANFNDPLEYQNYLQTPAADLLWTDSEEIQAMCNMFQMSATIVLASVNEEDIPSIVQVGPDPDIKEIGLSNTTLIGVGKVPHMFLLL